MDSVKKLGSTFIIGGTLGVIGQLLLTMYINLLGPNSPLLIALLLVSMGLIGGILFALGIYQKLEAIGGFGAILPFSGFCTGIAGAVAGTRKSGGSVGQSITAGLMVVLFIIGLGTLFSIIVGLVGSYFGG